MGGMHDPNTISKTYCDDSGMSPLSGGTKRRNRGITDVDPKRKSSESLFDHLVGAAKQGNRYGESERFRGLEVDRKFKFGWLLYWQIPDLFSA